MPSAAVPHASRPLLWLVAASVFMQMLDSSIVNTALPSMANSLGESPLQMQSVVMIYALANAVFIPASGWLADRFGTRHVYLIAVLLFAAGSLACALSQSLAQLVASRALQGLGGALLLPVGRLAILRTVSREEFLPAMSFVAIPALVGPLVGPTLGGWLTEIASWHWIFLINLPIGVLAIPVALRVMPNHRGRERTRFDAVGYLLLAIGMVLLTLALDGLSGLGTAHALVLLMAVFGLAAMAGYWLHAGAVAHPLFPLQMFRLPSFRIGILGNLFSRVGSGSVPYLIPLLLQVGMGLSPMQAGTMMVPVALAGMASKRAAVMLVGRFGYRRVLMVNTVLVGLMIAAFVLVGAQQPLWLRIVQFALFGAVNSLQFTAMNTVTLRDLDTEYASAGNSLLSMVMMLATSFGVAAAGSLLAAFDQYLGAHGAQLPLQATFICMGTMTLASTLVFWQLPDQRPPARTVEPVAE
ncbi:MFS transporter [Pseudoxanthomonas kalamensis DSM 18571]|uniref:multidrug transporter subunit MdtD n=1 Tax=Pseudoxanthomonas kalamensis TaxID=289483 RepID=UPI00139178E8|nr:multidrug transporter subunit MdtD [Pseudoxanthomonas kalamensis]KAF1711262.1 MFS transporter [Pseudoxanthomonas kalamensis DSM 18571]